MRRNRLAWFGLIVLTLHLLLSGGCVLPQSRAEPSRLVPDSVSQQLRDQTVSVRAPHDVMALAQAFVREAGATVILEGRAPLTLAVEVFDKGQREAVPGLRVGGQPMWIYVASAQATLVRDEGHTKVLMYQGQGMGSADAREAARQRAALRAMQSLR